MIGTLAVDGWGYIWYSGEGLGRAAVPPSPLLTVPNVTAHPSTGFTTEYTDECLPIVSCSVQLSRYSSPAAKGKLALTCTEVPSCCNVVDRQHVERFAIRAYNIKILLSFVFTGR